MEDNRDINTEIGVNGTTVPEVSVLRSKKESKNPAREIFDWLEVMVISLAAILIVFTYCGRVAVVDGDSMNHSLISGESLIISNAFYDPQPGDIVVFQIPGNEGVLGQPLIKRVIATGGQTVYLDTVEWKTYVYDDAQMPISMVKATVKPFEERFDINIRYENGLMEDGYGTDYPFTVPEGKMFVMGDNRNNSTDSRFPSVGAVDERYILGKAYFRITPFDKMGAVS